MSQVNQPRSNTPSAVSREFQTDPDIQSWLKMGRIAKFLCLWAAMIIPVLLVISTRF